MYIYFVLFFDLSKFIFLLNNSQFTPFFSSAYLKVKKYTTWSGIGGVNNNTLKNKLTFSIYFQNKKMREVQPFEEVK